MSIAKLRRRIGSLEVLAKQKAGNACARAVVYENGRYYTMGGHEDLGEELPPYPGWTIRVIFGPPPEDGDPNADTSVE